jgi:hypothetical protein
MNPSDAPHQDVETVSRDITDIVNLATAMLRVNAHQDGFCRLRTEITRRWPALAPEHQDYAVGYALGFLAAQDSILEPLGKPTWAELGMERHGRQN